MLILTDNMQELNLPPYFFRIKEEGGVKRIFDPIRKRYLFLTPEEWVRQHFVQYLVQVKKIPASLIQLEKGLVLNSLRKRADILASDSQGRPALIVECKAPSVKIDQDVFDQVARYNFVFKVPYLIVTNGMNHYCCLIDHTENTYRFLDNIPMYDEIK